MKTLIFLMILSSATLAYGSSSLIDDPHTLFPVNRAELASATADLFRPIYAAQGIDRISVVCLGCHDGTVAPVAHYKDVVDHQVWRSHPIGQLVPRSAGFRQDLSATNVVLVDGQVSCVSCHDMGSPLPGMLARDNRGSELCLACHQK